jgi:AraC-like DNA-binding protein
MLMEPGEVHATTKVETAGCFRVLFIDRQAMARATASMDLQGGSSHLVPLDSVDAARVSVAALGELHAALERGDALATSELFVEALWRIFRACAERAPALPDPPPPQRMRAVRDRIHDAFQTDPQGKFFCVEGLAADVGMTDVQLIRAWRRYWGCPVWVYVMRLRLSRAVRMILAGPRDGMRTFADVALASGYADLSHADRSFKQMLGVSPCAFARQAGVYPAWWAAQAQSRSGPRRC